MKRHKKVTPSTTETGRTDDSSNQNSGEHVVETGTPQEITPVVPVQQREDIVSKSFLKEIMASLKTMQERQNKEDKQTMKLTQSNQPQGNQMYQIPQELMMKLLLK